jgi:predicted dehydrogenase
MADQLGAVVVGTGFGCLTHVRALRAAGFEVRALVGQDPERTRQRASRFEIPAASTSVTEAVALPGVDAVTVATPPYTHAAIALAAIEADKHVLCEKPFARDTAEAERMLEAADARGVIHMLGAEFRWASGQALMARAVAEGEIGRPQLATFLLHIPLLADPTAEVPGWWSDAGQGGGWLGAHAPHVIDQIRSTLGEFDAVCAALPHMVERAWTVEDTYTVHFRLESGVEGVMQSTAADWGPLLIMSRIAGSAGTIWAEGDHVQVADRSGTRSLPIPEDLVTPPADPPPGDLMLTAYDLLHSTGLDMGPWTRMAETFRDLILGRTVATDPAPATFADGVALMRVLDAVRRSAADGGWVPVG